MKINDKYEVKITDVNGQSIIAYNTEMIMSATAKENQNKELNTILMQTYAQFLNEMVKMGLSIKGVKITSFWRNYVPNGGSKNSYHLTGKAIDFYVPNYQIICEHILKNKHQYGWIGGLGVYDTHVHLDVGTQEPKGLGAPYFRYWDNRKKKGDIKVSNIDDTENEEDSYLGFILLGLGLFFILFFR